MTTIRTGPASSAELACVMRFAAEIAAVHPGFPRPSDIANDSPLFKAMLRASRLEALVRAKEDSAQRVARHRAKKQAPTGP